MDKIKSLNSKMKRQRKGISPKYHHIKSRNLRSLVELELAVTLVEHVEPADVESGLSVILDFADHFIVLTNFCIKNPFFQD